MSNLIHWNDGLFVQPHHLQTFQRTAREALAEAPRWHAPFPYGVIHAEFSTDSAANEWVRFDKLHAVLPDGTIFRASNETTLPGLNVARAIRTWPEGFIVGLAVPIWTENGPNTVPKPSVPNPQAPGAATPDPSRRYQVIEEKIVDENDGKRSQNVQFLRLNGRLAFQEENNGDADFLPLIRIIASGVDPHYVPPTLLLAGSPVLLQLVRGLAVNVSAAHKQLGEQLAADQENGRSSSTGHLSRLRCLARGAALLGSITDHTQGGKRCEGRMPLYHVYLAVQDLLAELASLAPTRRILSWERYDHDNPYPGFADLDAKIRDLLTPEPDHYLKFDFFLERDRFFGDVPDRFFQGITGCYLAIETTQPPDVLASLVANRDHFKLLPASYQGRLAVRGLVLRVMHGAPEGLPPRTGRYYYQVDDSASGAVVWEDFRREPRAAVHFQVPDLSAYRLSLYVTLPPRHP